MDKLLASISLETLAATPRGTPDGRNLTEALTAISMATHGDRDISSYEGFDLLVSGHGEAEKGSILKPRFAALLRRREDGAIRMIRAWALDAFMDGDIMVPHDERRRMVEAFGTHDEPTRAMVEAIYESYERVKAMAADVRAHDASVLRELSWHARRAAARVMTPDLGRTLSDTAVDLTPEREGPLKPPPSRPSWHAEWSGEPWYVGHPTSIGKHHATNHHHLKSLTARLDEAGDHEAASTIRWLGWNRDLDLNRDRFLADEAVKILHRRVDLLETTLTTIAGADELTHYYTDSTMRKNPTECLSAWSIKKTANETLEESREMGRTYDAYAGKKD